MCQASGNRDYKVMAKLGLQCAKRLVIETAMQKAA